MPVTTAREQAAPVASGAADSPLGARIGPAWPALVIAALVAVAAGAVVRASIGRGHPSVARTAERGRALPRDGLLSLPLAAQGPVSAALGADERSYDFTGLRAVNPAQRLRIGFSRAGVTVASGRARLGLGLAGFGYAGALRRFGPASPRASANRLSYGHGSVREWFANGPLGLEQGFDVASRPSAGNGPLTLALALSGNLHPRLKDDSLLLQGRGVALRYRGLVASDAHGRLLHSWLALRGDRLLLRVDDRGAAYPLRIDPFVQQAELTFGEMESHFGYSVAISGDTLVVGAENFTPPLLHAGQGAAFVFVAPNSNWVAAAQKSELTSTYGESFDHLGSSVAISGSTVVAGAPEHQVGLTKDQGALSVFVEPPSGWEPVQSQNAELSVKGGAETEFLGDSVAMSGSAIVAGAPGYASDQGAAYMFVPEPTGWSGEVHQAARLTASDGGPGDDLGEAGVAISGNTVVAGARGNGRAYVFVMPPTGWAGTPTQTAELAPSESAPYFGFSVAIEGETIVVGAPYREVETHFRQGAAFVFVMPPSGWANGTQTAELTASGGQTEELLGWSVAISGEKVVAGAYRQNGEPGAAYVFAMPPSGWAGSVHQGGELTATEGLATDELGRSVATSGNAIVAGAYRRAIETHLAQGAAYVFTAPFPTVAITVPANGSIYTQGSALASSFSCGAPAGASVTACTGPVANGAPIDTSTPGAHTFTVTATDGDGLTETDSVAYTVVPGPPVAGPPPVGGTETPGTAPLPPRISALSETARAWREGGAPASISSRRGRRPPLGTTFSFHLNEPAAVTLTFTEPASGRRVGRRCLAPTRRNRRKRRCSRTLTAGMLAFSAHAGVDRVRFDGVLAGHGRLGLGSYTLRLTASAAGMRSTPATLNFTIVRG